MTVGPNSAAVVDTPEISAEAPARASAGATAKSPSGSGVGVVRRRTLPGIDGLRAVAVAAVVVYHAAPGALPGGFLGVDLFFVISGFVITRLLVAQSSSTGIRLADFWQRRARRLLPAVLLVILGVQLVSHLQGLRATTGIVRGQSLAALVYGSNWYNVFAHLSYWDAGLNASPLNHLWSLAIEEQFYLVWPVLLLVFRSRRVRLWLAGLGMAASAALQLAESARWDVNRLYLGTDTRAAALLAGALVALALASSRPKPRAGLSRATRRVLDAAIVGGLAGLAVLWVRVGLDTALFHGELLGATALEALVVMAVALRGTGWPVRVLGSMPFTYVGKRSYALYLWHWPVIVLVTRQGTHLAPAGVALLRALLIASLTLLSYRLVETPIRYSSLRGYRLVAALLVPVLALFGWTITFHPKPSAALAEVRSNQQTLRVGTGGARLLVVGDSWSRNLAVGMAEVDKRTTIDDQGLGGCGIADATAYRTAERGTFANPAQCSQWQTTWTAAMRADAPDAAVLVVGNWDQALAQVNGRWVRPCDPAFDTRYAAKLDRALTILGGSGTPVFMTNVIDGASGELLRLSNCMNDMLAAAARRHSGVVLLNLEGYLCPGHSCPSVLDGAQVYDDTGHLAPPWQKRVATWVLDDVYQRITVSSSHASHAGAPAYYEPALPPPADVTAVLGGPARRRAVRETDNCGRGAVFSRAVQWARGSTKASVMSCQYLTDGPADARARSAISAAQADGYVFGYRSPDYLTQVLQRLGPHQRLSSIVIVRLLNRVAVATITGPRKPESAFVRFAGAMARAATRLRR